MITPNYSIEFASEYVIGCIAGRVDLLCGVQLVRVLSTSNGKNGYYGTLFAHNRFKAGGSFPTRNMAVNETSVLHVPEN